MNQIGITLPTVMSLRLAARYNGAELGVSTGFVVRTSKGDALVTNRHVVTGLHQDTGKVLSSTGGVPNELRVYHHAKLGLGGFYSTVEPLYDELGNQRWTEHPALGAKADLVALPVSVPNEVELYPYQLNAPVELIRVGNSDVVSVIGFPFGLTGAAGFAIWATGFVASEPAINYENVPVFLIDCRTRQGQSGSAVIAYRSGGMIPMENGSIVGTAASSFRLLGIYSGRVNAESDLGRVWKLSAIEELVNSLR